MTNDSELSSNFPAQLRTIKRLDTNIDEPGLSKKNAKIRVPIGR